MAMPERLRTTEMAHVAGEALSPRRGSAYQAFRILHVAFVVAPIIAGIDKYFHYLVNWDQYLAPIVTRVLPISAHPFMLIVGAIEIVAGLIVAAAPRYGAYLVMAWLWAIIINLLLVPGYFDIALRDFGLSLGALALARLAPLFDGRSTRDR